MKKLLVLISTLILMITGVVGVGCGEPAHVHEYVNGICECGEKQEGYYTPGLTFSLKTDGSGYVVTKFDNKSGKVIIPEQYEGKPVLEIGPDAFLSCSKVANVTLPNTLKVIDDYAFYGSRIVSVTIPEKVERIGEGAFKDCIWLKEIIYSATNCGTFTKGTFDGSGTSVEEGITVTISKNVKAVPDFFLCPVANASSPFVTSIIFEDNGECETIGEQAFWDMRNTKVLTFGANSKIKEIKNSAFGNVGWRTELNDIVIPASVEKIGKYALAFIKLNKDPAKMIFENTDGWYYTTSNAEYNGKTGGTAITEADLLGKSPYAAFGGGNYLYRVDK